MKKTTIILISLIVLGAFFSAEITELTGKASLSISCKDSDGKDYYTKGKTTYKIWGRQTIYTDKCKNSKVLYEYYCSGGKLKEKAYTCPNGCSNGACLREKVECMDNSDCPEDYICVNNKCVKEEQKCTDSDGLNLGVKGITKGYEVQGVIDSFTDYCGTAGSEAGKLKEYYCKANNFVGFGLYSCPEGYECKDGACIKTKPVVHFFVVDDNGPASDVMLIANLQSSDEIQTRLALTGEDSISKLNSEVTKADLDNRVMTFIDNERALITVGETSPAEHALLATIIEKELKKLGVVTITKVMLSSEITSDDFRLELNCGNINCFAGYICENGYCVVEGTDYLTTTIEYDSNPGLDEANYPGVTVSNTAVKISTTLSAFELNNGKTTDTIWVTAVSSGFEVFYKDRDANPQIQHLGNSLRAIIAYKGTPLTRLRLRADRSTYPSDMIELRIEYPVNEDIIKSRFWIINDKITSLGSIQSKAESNEVEWYITTQDESNFIGLSDKDLVLDWIVVKNPKLNGASDQVVLDVAGN